MSNARAESNATGSDTERQNAACVLLSSESEREKAAKKKERKSNKYKVLCLVLPLCMLAALLGCIFGLKPSCSKDVNSCRYRCFERKFGPCRCDIACIELGNCCLDFQEVCVQPAKLWTCSKFRCSEKRLQSYHCSCADDCVVQGDCCYNYNFTCKGVKRWVEEECEEPGIQHCPKGYSKPPLILFSLDGFRAEYLKSYGRLLPVINRLKKCGTHAASMRPIYPTKTFPNHYSIVTGLYAESHGIIDNGMYDVTRNANFSLRSPEKFNPIWYQGQPIWLTAKYQGLKAATLFWPGSDVRVNGSFPDIYKTYNGSLPYEERIQTILEWLRLPEDERPHFYTLYLDEPDSSGHKYGPVSGEVIEALQRVDNMVGMLMDGLKEMKLDKCVNLILLSDHGMEKCSCKKFEYLENYLDSVDELYAKAGPSVRIRPKDSPDKYFTFNYEDLMRNLTCKKPDQHFKPYLKKDLPKRFHYANSKRIENVHLYMDRQWQAALQNLNDPKYCTGGFHGSDNQFNNMQAIFIAFGPGFKFKTEVPPFENIEVYNLMCDLLEIQPAENNGTRGSLNRLLRKPAFEPFYPTEVSVPSSCQPTSQRQVSKCPCISAIPSGENLKRELTLSDAEVQKTEAFNLPYGKPAVLQSISHCLLHRHQYISAFSHDFQMPLWTAYTVNKPLSTMSLVTEVRNCLPTDFQLSSDSSISCIKTELKSGFLYPPNIHASTQVGQFNGQIISNIVPMHPAFRSIWNYFNKELLPKYAAERNGINVITGPVFDRDYDGHFDSVEDITRNASGGAGLLPTHYFVVLTSCRNASMTPTDCTGSLDVTSFIIPHRADNSESCADGKNESQWVEERIRFHVARVRDVELLTGLSFYHGRIQAVTDILQLKTFLPSFEEDDD
ncbi:ectonucleotide pyrophosphatase/phosphodiesterase family member 1 [Protopterus annectens]|uniref:ectonucleotide pyrophosphatase/phosphodiesterase family member 1 n=1 Tax=Protopterus annectens TaxID=7888 RepID=UPI001CF94BD3|nr:ectonucleotide pyrophosphatase/phosphodiesterase family member 1 [Protopterus annectens]